MPFPGIIGQTAVKKRLGEALTGQPGHAYVFTGPRGIGRRSLAMLFAQGLLCEQPDEDGPCFNCTACHHFQNQVHPDFRRLSLEKKEKNIKVERVRHQISADMSMQPQFGNRKVYLIPVDDLNEQGQNALLKSLEEPPPYVCFLLTVEQLDRLLPTIRSRVVPLIMQRLNREEITAILREKQAGDPATWPFYASFSGGIPGVAVDFAGSEWFGSLRQECLDLYDSLGQAGRARLLTSGFDFFERNREQTSLLLDLLGSLIRDQMVCLTGGADLTNSDQLDLLKRQPVYRLSSEQARVRLDRAYLAILSAQRGLTANASFELLVCQLLLTLRKELIHA